MEPYRPPARRAGHSGGWNRFGVDRIKPVSEDALNEYQLPSKGEKRLHDYKTQERYYSKIVDRYMKFCAVSGSSDELDKAFLALSINDGSAMASGAPGETPRPSTAAAEDRGRPPIPHRTSSSDSKSNDLPVILLAMRKLREGMLGARRTDAFAQRAYMFIIHAGILSRNWESYSHALQYLLYTIHARTPLAPAEVEEFAGYHTLDLVCRQQDFPQTFLVKNRFELKDHKILAIVRAVVRDDWVRFWRLEHQCDGYQRAMMEAAEPQMRRHALKCLSRSYLQADKAFIERATGSQWSDLVKEGVAWQLLDNGTVMIRKPKAK